MMFTSFLLLALCCLLGVVRALGSTDTITWGGDNSRTGYQNNHNMDPAIVGSAQFGQLFRTALPGNYNGAAEQVFSQPLVYTSNTDNVQYVYVATTQNNLYKLDAKTGVIVLQRNLHIPFLTSDLSGCVDINPLVGVTATGVIDPDTDTLYLTSKTYIDQSPNGAKGRPNGRYYVHAINVHDLSERPNFPVNLEGTVARNNPIRSFNGGIHHQRPALLHSGQYIYAGFASHCVQYNFTGWIMGWDKTTGATVERYATEGLGVPNTTPGGGVWMSGGGIASDNAGSMFFGTGNGYASQLNGIPVAGHNPPTALEEAAVHMTINADGSLTIVDFFMPWEKTQLDGADRDLGTTPLELLPSQFSCGDVKRIGVITGKSGKTYWIDLDNMGGYQNGPNKLDAVLQVYQNENSVYAGAGVYPLEGGYIYISVIQYPTHVFKFSCSNGVPSFTKVADSPENNAYILGVGHGTVTSLNDQPGSGLLWTSDVEGYNLRIYNAVPQNGLLTEIAQFNVPGTTKFTRPVFGDGRAYMGTTVGYFYGFGAPVNLPLNCSSPYDFGTSNLNAATAPMTITCVANIAVQVTNIVRTGNPNFVVSSVPALPLSVAAGKTFSFQAVFNPGQVGPLSSDVIVNTTNSVTGYSINTPVTLKGNGQSVAALLSVSPVTLAFQGVITGQQVGGVNQSVIFTNLGNSPLTITSIQYSLESETGPFEPPTASPSGPKAGPFTFINLPTTIPGNSAAIVTVNFNSPVSGNFAVYLTVNSNGGSKIFDVVGTSGDIPAALVEFQTTDGKSWVPYSQNTPFTFGNVTENTSRSLKMRLTNVGGPNAARLSVTVSKPPFGVPGIIDANNQVDLAEGTSLGPGENATATLYCAVPKSQINVNAYNGTAQWTLNVNDPNFGKQLIQFYCNAVSEQYPPLASNGNGIYRYIGCFLDNNPGRQLPTQIYSSASNTNEMCLAACYGAGYVFAGTEYNRECWCGPNIPNLQVADLNCNYPCLGNINEVCGGNGVANNPGAYISVFASSKAKLTASSGPFVNPGALGFVSQGCYTEATNSRALLTTINISANATVYNCLAACAGYKYAGVEYGQECYCGNTLQAGSVPTVASSCSMLCAGNSSEYCGAGSRLNMYLLGGSATSSSSSSSTKTTSTSSTLTTSSSSTSSSTSTTTSSTSSRSTTTSSSSSTSTTTSSSSSTSTTTSSSPTKSTMTSSSSTTSTTTSSSSSTSTTTSSSSTSASATSTSTSTSISSTTSSKSSSSTTSTTSSSSSRTSTSTTSTSSSSSTSTTSTTSSTTTSSPPSGTAASWVSIGCVNEINGRTLNLQSYAANTMTVESCQAFCLSYHLPLAGVEYGRECYCGSTLPTTATPGNTGCNMACAGNPAETCGGASRLTMYNNTANVPTALVPAVGKFTLQGCFSEPPNGGRALQTRLNSNATGQTVELCVAGCSGAGYSWAGLEFGQECWCDNSVAAGTAKVSNSQCSFPCPGNTLEYCGAGQTLVLYHSS